MKTRLRWCSIGFATVMALGACKKGAQNVAPETVPAKGASTGEAAVHAAEIVAALKAGQPDARKAALRAVQWLPSSIPVDLTIADLKAVFDLPVSAGDAGAAAMSTQGLKNLAMSIIASRKLVKSAADAQWITEQSAGEDSATLLSSIGDALASDCQVSAGVVWPAITTTTIMVKVDKNAINRLGPYVTYMRECGGDQAQGALFVALLDAVVGEARRQVSSAQSSWSGPLDRQEASATLTQTASLMGAAVKLPFDVVEPSLTKLVKDRFLGSTARRLLAVGAANHPEAASRVQGNAGNDAWMTKVLAAQGKVDDAALPKLDKLPIGPLTSVVRLTGNKAAVARLGQKLCEKGTDLDDRAHALEALLFAQMRLDKPSDAQPVSCGLKGKPPAEAQFADWLKEEKAAFLALNGDGVAALDATPGAWALPLHLLRIGQNNEAAAVLAVLQASPLISAEKAMDAAMHSISASSSLAALQATTRRMERANRLLQMAISVDLKDVAMAVALFGRRGQAIRSLVDEALAETGAQRSKEVTPELLRLLSSSPASSDAAFVAGLVRAVGNPSRAGKNSTWSPIFTWVDHAEIVKLVKDRCATGFDAGSVYALSLQSGTSASDLIGMAKSGALLCREQAAYALSLKASKSVRDEMMTLLNAETDPVMKVALRLALARVDG